MENPTWESQKSLRRLRAMALLAKCALYGKMDVTGLDNIDNLKGQPVIFACSHRNDHDMIAAASVLAARRSIKIASMSSNFDRKLESTVFKLSGGNEVFTPINYKIGENGIAVPGLFSPDNYIPMENALSLGNDIMLAAHNPSKDGRLAKRPGIAVPYLAYRTGASIIPVNVEFDGQSEFPDLFLRGSLLRSAIKRPKVRVIFGDLLELDFSENTVPIAPDENSRLSGGDIKILRARGELVMQAIRNLSTAL